MAATKTTTLTFRIEPRQKEALRTVADQERRSIANMVEVMTRAKINGVDPSYDLPSSKLQSPWQRPMVSVHHTFRNIDR